MTEARRRYAQNNDNMSQDEDEGEDEDEESFLPSLHPKAAKWRRRRHGRHDSPRDPRCAITIGLTMTLILLLSLVYWIMYVSRHYESVYT